MNDKIEKAVKTAQRKYIQEHRGNAGGLSPEARERAKEYQKNWKKNHPEAVKMHNRRFFLKKAIEYGFITEDELDETREPIKNTIEITANR